MPLPKMPLHTLDFLNQYTIHVFCYLFCCGVLRTIKCLLNPSSWKTSKKGFEVYSPLLSNWKVLILLPVWVFTIFIHFRKISRTLSLHFIMYTYIVDKSSIEVTNQLLLPIDSFLKVLKHLCECNLEFLLCCVLWCQT